MPRRPHIKLDCDRQFRVDLWLLPQAVLCRRLPFAKLLDLANSLDQEQRRAVELGLTRSSWRYSICSERNH